MKILTEKITSLHSNSIQMIFKLKVELSVVRSCTQWPNKIANKSKFNKIEIALNKKKMSFNPHIPI